MNDFLDNLDNLNLLDERLMTNNKNRHLSLIKENLNSKDIFDNIYQVNYSGSLAYLGQAQRHRTLNYTMSFKSDDEYYIPDYKG